MTNGPFLLDDIPPGVPGRVAMCEWCGRYVNNYNLGGKLQWCPTCSKGTLRTACGNCGTPIPVPPQLKCLNCGEWLTIMPMVDTPNGPVPKEIREPEPDRRKILESEGNNWYDVIRGKAEGPPLKNPAVEGVPPQGWTRRQWQEFMGDVLREHGEIEPEVEEPRQIIEKVCQKCGMRHFGPPEKLKVCLVCKTPFAPEAPQEGQNLDNGDAMH